MKLTIITPCCRPDNLIKLKGSIRFDLIDKWIIVYDTSKDRSYKMQFQDDSKILELECNILGAAGHPQRNFAIHHVNHGYIYMLDDDNIMHPEFWNICPLFELPYFYTFDLLNNNTLLPGNNIKINKIDTSMFCVNKEHLKDIRWREDIYEADGYFIMDINKSNKDLHKYINKVAAYYNFLGKTPTLLNNTDRCFP
jgi:hypothetical protein